MCRTVHAVLSALICFAQMFVRVFMTCILMLENLIRMLLQTLYNLLSFLLQLVSLIPICCVFIISSRLKCFMCGGGGPCPINRGGMCDCMMSILALVILFFIFRATGALDKIFFTLGYARAPPSMHRFRPTPGAITECSRNDSDTEYVFYPLETSSTQRRRLLRIDDVYTDYTDFTEFNTRIERMKENMNDTKEIDVTNSHGTEKHTTTIPALGRAGKEEKLETKYDVIETTELTMFATYEDTGGESTKFQDTAKMRNFADTTELRLQDWTTVLYYLA